MKFVIAHNSNSHAIKSGLLGVARSLLLRP